jgi:molybdopterin synthase catalytic subunit
MTRLFRITEDPIGVSAVVSAVERPEAGGTTSFVGTVRNENEGRAVTLLEYQAYVPMAEKEMQRLADSIEARRPEVRLAAEHRIGALQIGDIAVVCAASAPHRDAAFAACREFIDEIKAHVPIWKREHGPDGPYWVGWEDARCTGQHGDATEHAHSHGDPTQHGDSNHEVSTHEAAAHQGSEAPERKPSR